LTHGPEIRSGWGAQPGLRGRPRFPGGAKGITTWKAAMRAAREHVHPSLKTAGIPAHLRQAKTCKLRKPLPDLS
jgi:hypothetical protein